MREKVSVVGAVIVALAAIFVIPNLGHFFSPEPVTQFLQEKGYKQVQITERAGSWVRSRGCRSMDLARFSVHAISSRGEPQDLYVCVSVFGNPMVRLR